MSFFSDLWDEIVALFSPTPAASPVVHCANCGALTPAQAQQWFDHFKSRTDIPWNYPNDCCYNRAEVMDQELTASGVDAGKAWNYEPDQDHPLRVDTPNDPNGYVQWGYHVAPTVPVMVDGVATPMVLDPSIASGPITPQQWKALQGQPGSQLVQTDAKPYYRSPEGEEWPAPDAAQITKTFDKHRARRAANWVGR